MSDDTTGKSQLAPEAIEFQRQMIAFSTEIAKSIQGVKVPNNFLSGLDNLIRGMQQAAPKIIPVLSEFGKLSINLAEAGRCEKLLSESGWLPHASIPVSLVRKHTNAPDLHRALDEYLIDRWAEVRDNIIARLAKLDINEGSKEVFREAMQAHEARLYRCVCRTLMPEIERAVRIDLNGGNLAYPPGPEGASSAGTILKSTAGERGLTETEPGGYFSLILFKKLKGHLYEKVGVGPERIAAIEADPVPNRHATVHGIVDYSSHQNSINAIFMADYTFQVISASKT